MKILIAILLTAMCSGVKAQIKITEPTKGPYYVIQMDSTFSFSTEDSVLVVTDSLLTIKFLIGLAIDNMKRESKKHEREPVFSNQTALLNYRRKLL